jgi:hypothetical protein
MTNKAFKPFSQALTSSRMVFAFFVAFLCLGLWIYQDFGVSTDEQQQREIGLTSLAYIANLFQIPFLLNGAAPLQDPASVFLAQKDRDYGVAFELPAEFLVRLLQLQDADVYFFRHLLTFLVFFCAVFFFYRLVKERYSSQAFGLLGALFLILSPRIFGDGFFNDKDLVFMSTFVIATYTLIRFVLQPIWKTGLWHALACAIAIDVRIMAIIIPAATLVTLVALVIRRDVGTSKAFGALSIYLIAMAALVVAFWPWLWLDPLGNFITAFKNMARFRHVIDMYFMGRIVSSGSLPWYYIPVWIGITTPILYSLFFLVGAIGTLRNLIFAGKKLWVNSDQLQDLLFLGLFLAPLTAVIVLNSVLYNGWRQMYFIYPAFVLVAIRGLVFLRHLTSTKKVLRTSLNVIVIISLSLTTFWMVRWHPYQYLYFNIFAGESSKRFDVDYWATAYRPLIQKIINQDSQEKYAIFFSTEGGVNWGIWQLDYLRSLNAFSSSDKNRVIHNRTENCSDYIFTVLAGNRKQYTEKKEFELFDELKVDGQIIYTTFKRKIPLYEYYKPEIGKPVGFDSPHTRCFLKSGWADNTEDWGTWTVGKEAKLAVFMPAGSPKTITLDLRAFVGPKHPKQSLEVAISGEQPKAFTLSQFEQNTIKLAIPAAAYGKEFLTIDFKMADPASPKDLGMGEDTRKLGVGIKRVVIE